MKIPANIKAAAIRAARTFGQSYLGAIVYVWAFGVPGASPTAVSITNLIRTVQEQSDLSAGIALFGALAALGVNAIKPITPEVKK